MKAIVYHYLTLLRWNLWMKRFELKPMPCFLNESDNESAKHQGTTTNQQEKLKWKKVFGKTSEIKLFYLSCCSQWNMIDARWWHSCCLASFVTVKQLSPRKRFAWKLEGNHYKWNTYKLQLQITYIFEEMPQIQCQESCLKLKTKEIWK